jgi:hypothetical protein
MVEIGNRDIVDHTSLSMVPMVQNRLLISVDMAEILEYKPHECKRRVGECAYRNRSIAHRLPEQTSREIC